jgi:type VI secretion system protein VasJ
MSADDAIQAAKTKLESLIAPIEGGVGEDLSYDEAFEAVKAEIDKQNQIEGGPIEWKNVEELSSDLIANRTKDFRLVLYYAMARTQKEGIVGLFEGLVVLNELCLTLWEPMYPALRRPRARGNLLSWFNELATPIVQAAQPTPQQRSVVEGLGKVFADLDAFLAEKLGEAYPPMMTLSDSVRSLVRRAPAAPVAAPEPPPPSVSMPQPAPSAEAAADSFAATPAEGAPQAGGAVMAAVSIVDADSAYVALQQVAPILGQASGALFNVDPASVDAYRLGMQAAFLLIGGDPYNENGQTTLPGPLDQVRQSLAALASSSDWQGLVNTGWQALQEQPFWLDASRALAQGLRGLGAPHDAAAPVVEREVAALLARAPSLPNLTFSDGTPLADGETQSWVGGLGAGGGGGGGGAKSPVDRAAAEATKLAGEGNLAQAMTVLSRAAQTTSPVDRFRARLEIAKLALSQQLLDMARAHLDALERSAEEHRLASWDPALCAELFANLYKVRRLIAQNTMDDPEIGKKAAQSFERLCELDAARAFSVMSEG